MTAVLADLVAKLDKERLARNNRIGAREFLNPLVPDLESMLLAGLLKIVFATKSAHSGKVEASDLSPIKRHLGSNTFTFHLFNMGDHRPIDAATLGGRRPWRSDRHHENCAFDPGVWAQGAQIHAERRTQARKHAYLADNSIRP
jgi:hypothetical protein